MQAYEFLAKPENGAILIPEEFRNKIVSDVKVIVLETKQNGFCLKEDHNGYKSHLLLPPILDTKGWKFNREEANER